MLRQLLPCHHTHSKRRSSVLRHGKATCLQEMSTCWSLAVRARVSATWRQCSRAVPSILAAGVQLGHATDTWAHVCVRLAEVLCLTHCLACVWGRCYLLAVQDLHWIWRDTHAPSLEDNPGARSLHCTAVGARSSQHCMGIHDAALAMRQ